MLALRLLPYALDDFLFPWFVPCEPSIITPKCTRRVIPIRTDPTIPAELVAKYGAEFTLCNWFCFASVIRLRDLHITSQYIELGFGSHCTFPPTGRMVDVVNPLNFPNHYSLGRMPSSTGISNHSASSSRSSLNIDHDDGGQHFYLSLCPTAAIDE